MWWDHDWNWAGWLAMSVGMVAFWVLVALLLLAVVVEEYRQRLVAMSQEHR